MSGGCLSGGDRFDGLTWLLRLHSQIHDVARTHVSRCVFLPVMCVCLWLMRGCGRCQSGAHPDVHRIWHCRANGVTGMWQGSTGPKWLFRLHYPAKTLDMPSPISHLSFMVTESFTIHKWSTDCTPLFTQYRLITKMLACTHTQKRQAHRHQCWESKRGAEGVDVCQQPLWLSCRKLHRLAFTSAPCPLMFRHQRPLHSDSICQGGGLKGNTLKVTEDMCH